MAEARDGQPILPGVLHALLFTALAFLLAHFTRSIGIGATALGVLLGVLVANIRPLAPVFKPGVSFVGKRVLTVAVVLLGLRVTLRDVTLLGGAAAVAVGVAVVVALLVAWGFGRLFKVQGALAALIGVGTAICGASAIAAARPAVGARDEDVSYAVAAVTALGSIGLLAYPALQLAFHPFTAAQFGIVSGASLHAVPQAVGAAFAGGGLEAGGLATIVKLSRVALLGPVVLLLGVLFHQPGTKRGALRLPVEVWGFLLLFGLGSLFVIPEGVRGVVADVDEVLLVWALTALGLQTRFADLRRIGVGPLVVALLTWGALIVGVVLVVAVS